jgi:sn-glycerol 3-phosphate transport system substrate-binding protein
MKTSPLRFVTTAIVAVLVAASCSSGESVLTSGDEARPTVTSGTEPAPTEPTSSTPGNGSTGDGAAGDGSTGQPTTPSTNATTTTTPLSELPPCPVDALDGVGGPVEITFWHGLNVDNEDAINRLTEEYNASQERVRVTPQNQGSYTETIDKYYQSGQSSRPDVVMFPEYMVQQTADSGSVIPVGACIEESAFDLTQFQRSALAAYSTAGVQWAMPFNVSNPVLYYNRSMFEAAGLDPDDPPRSLEELREYSQAIVDSGAAAYGIAVDTGSDSGGGWFLEQWFANAGEFYADNGNGRLAPATRVLYDGPFGVELLTYVQQLLEDGLAVNVGDNAGGGDHFFKLADQAEPAAMTIGTSAVLRNVLDAVEGGLVPGITSDDIGIGALPGPGPVPTALIGGASLYVVADHGDDVTAAAWDYIQYLVSPEVQSLWATLTGYVPVRDDALELEPVATVYSDDPRFRVAYDQLIGSPDDLALQGPILGPQREVRNVTARAVAEIFAGADVQQSLSAAAQQANALIADYNARN